MSDADINLNPESGIMTIRINLRSEKDLSRNKIFSYGVLKLAEDNMSRFFIVEEMKMQKMKEGLGLVKPNGLVPPH